MTKKRNLLMAGCAFLLAGNAAWWQVQAEDAPSNPKPLQFELKLLQVADSHPPQFLLVLDKFPSSLIYKSLSSPSLRMFIHNFPDGTTITWNGHTNSRILSQNPESRKQIGDVDNFAAYCKKEGVVFTIRR